MGQFSFTFTVKLRLEGRSGSPFNGLFFTREALKLVAGALDRYATFKLLYDIII